MKNPSVLVGTVTWKGHSHLLEEWLQQVRGFTYPNYDVLMVDTSTDMEHFNRIDQEKDIKAIKVKSTDDLPSIHIVLAYARERIRQETLLGDYDYCFMLDNDMVVPEDSIEILMRHDKEWVGFPYQYKFKKPSAFKSGQLKIENKYCLDLYENWEILEKKPELIKAYAAGMGCSLFKRKVFEKVPFRCMKRMICGEDIWFNNEAHDKGIEAYLDTSIEPIHRTTEWDDESEIKGNMIWAVLEYKKKNNSKNKTLGFKRKEKGGKENVKEEKKEPFFPTPGRQ